MQSVEFAHAVTRTVLAFPERKQLHGSAGATNSSDMLGPFPRVSPDAAGRFTCLHKDKSKLYAGGIVAAGGSVAGDPGETSMPSPVGNDCVPFNYHEMHIKVYEDITQYFCGRAIIDLTCSDGVAIIHAIQQRNAYLGVCFSEDHKMALRKYVVNRLFESFQSPGDPLFNSDMVAEISCYAGPAPVAGSAPGAAGAAPSPAPSAAGVAPLPAPGAAGGVPGKAGSAASVRDALIAKLSGLNDM